MCIYQLVNGIGDLIIVLSSESIPPVSLPVIIQIKLRLLELVAGYVISGVPGSHLARPLHAVSLLVCGGSAILAGSLLVTAALLAAVNSPRVPVHYSIELLTYRLI